MGMDVDYIAGHRAIEDLETLLSSQPHGEREDIANEIIDFVTDMKNKWNNPVIELRRKDLNRNLIHLKFDEISIYHFKSSSLSQKDINKAHVIMFIDDDGKIKYLKKTK